MPWGQSLPSRKMVALHLDMPADRPNPHACLAASAFTIRPGIGHVDPSQIMPSLSCGDVEAAPSFLAPFSSSPGTLPPFLRGVHGAPVPACGAMAGSVDASQLMPTLTASYADSCASPTAPPSVASWSSSNGGANCHAAAPPIQLGKMRVVGAPNVSVSSLTGNSPWNGQAGGASVPGSKPERLTASRSAKEREGSEFGAATFGNHLARSAEFDSTCALQGLATSTSSSGRIFGGVPPRSPRHPAVVSPAASSSATPRATPVAATAATAIDASSTPSTDQYPSHTTSFTPTSSSPALRASPSPAAPAFGGFIPTKSSSRKSSKGLAPAVNFSTSKSLSRQPSNAANVAAAASALDGYLGRVESLGGASGHDSPLSSSPSCPAATVRKSVSAKDLASLAAAGAAVSPSSEWKPLPRGPYTQRTQCTSSSGGSSGSSSGMGRVSAVQGICSSAAAPVSNERGKEVENDSDEDEEFVFTLTRSQPPSSSPSSIPSKSSVSTTSSSRHSAEIEGRRKPSLPQGGLKLKELLRNRSAPAQCSLERSGPGSDACRTFLAKELYLATAGWAPKNIIGKGMFGTVFRGSFNGNDVAVKRLEGDIFANKDQYEMEVQVLSSARHANIVHLVGHCPETYCLVYEYLSGGSVEDYLDKKKRDAANRSPLPWRARVRIIADMAAGLAYLHGSGESPIVHRDLKPGNVLLDESLRGKLGDVGLARSVEEGRENITYTVSGTAGYVDPESMTTFKISPVADVFAFGVIMLQLLTGEHKATAVHNLIESLSNEGSSLCRAEAGPAERVVQGFANRADASAGDWPEEVAVKVAAIGLQCCHRKRAMRPDLVTGVLPVLETLVRWEGEGPKKADALAQAFFPMD